MEICFLGTGTSQGVPVIACQCVVCLSPDPLDKRLRTSILVSTNNTQFVIDTGPDFRQQMLRENIKNLDAVIMTHEHKDHIAGLDDVRPFNYWQKIPMPIYCTSSVQEAIKREYQYIFENSDYPGVPKLDLITIDENPFQLNGIKITPIPVSHATLPVLGFRINNFTYITDANHIDEKYYERIYGSDVLVLNALRREKHISHYTLAEALEMIKILKPKKTYLTHISHQLGLASDLEKELPENVFLAYDGLRLKL